MQDNQITVTPDGEAISPWCVVYNEVGIHARPASILSQTASKFKSAVQIKKGEKSVNAKSVISIMGLGVKYLEQVQISAKGEDAEQAVTTIIEAIRSGLGEEVKIPSTGSNVDNKCSSNKSSCGCKGDASSKTTAQPNEIKDFSKETTLNGVLASPGLIIGKSFVYTVDEVSVEENSSDTAKERERLVNAINNVTNHIKSEISVAVKNKEKTKEEIFQAHLSILNDESVISDAKELINSNKTAAYSWKKVMDDSIQLLFDTNDPLLRERAADYKDIQRQVIGEILGIKDSTSVNIPKGSIIIASDLVPSDIIKFGSNLSGLILAEGSQTSHVSLIIRNMGIPSIVAVGKSILNVSNNVDIILDANKGYSIVNPSKEKLEQISQEQDRLKKIKEINIANAHKPARTKDGVEIIVKGNISNSEQAKIVSTLGAQGIGLFRTEFLFFNSKTAPTEAEQILLYQEVADAVKDGEQVTIRTLDVGGDKPLAYVEIDREENPILGMRGVRNYPGNKDVFSTQIRAILRVKPLSKIKIMIPMVADAAEISWAREFILNEKSKLGIKEDIAIGTMIEVPSAALISDQIAPHADFFSIGTNDLTQYTLAMDRGNPKLTARLKNLHPAVLKLIKSTVLGGDKYKINTAICGAMASEILAIPVVIGLGVTELSASMRSIPDIKALIRELDHGKCIAAAEKAMLMRSAEEVEEFIKKEFGL